MKISIITPSLNSAAYLQDAIDSVMMQEYKNVEHIVVDGGSSDGTMEILKRNPHLIWVSEKDGGQADAMNKGFRMSSGDIIGYLNADDYYYPDAFKSIIPYFLNGCDFVVGKIKVMFSDGSFLINDPQTDFDKMIRHWEQEAFCVNPVGYFYTRKVQGEVGGYNSDNHYAMDLEFLLNSAKKFRLTKMFEENILGVFRFVEQCKTHDQNINNLSLWTNSNFSFIDKILSDMPADYVNNYKKDQEKGYKRRRILQRAEIIEQELKNSQFTFFQEFQLKLLIKFLYLKHHLHSQYNNYVYFPKRS
ncbi:MAG: glycosyltransferase [Bacteroidales bacterium]|nr:glycosyltransferase [Bacteroidales bacterium]